MFEKLREEVKRYRDRRGIRTGTLLESGVITALSAGTSGSVAAVITTPIDVVKTRIMLAAADSAGSDSQKQGRENVGSGLRNKGTAIVDAMGHAIKQRPVRKSSLQIGREIVAESGVKGLWRGGALRGIWTMLGSGIYLGVYDSGRIWLGSRRGEAISEEDLS